MRLNGNLVWQLQNKVIRKLPTDQWAHFHGQLYQGGEGLPKKPEHYRLAHCYVNSNGWCGVPDAVVATQK